MENSGNSSNKASENASSENRNQNTVGELVLGVAAAVAVGAGIAGAAYLLLSEQPSNNEQPRNNLDSCIQCENYEPPEEGNCDTPIGSRLPGYNPKCPICFVEFDVCTPTTLLECEHRIHSYCLPYHTQCSSKKNLCPYCQLPIKVQT